MADPLPTAHRAASLRDLSELLAQLRAGEPEDFGRIARRTSEAAERLLELLWLERAVFGAIASSDEATGHPQPADDDPVAFCLRGWVDWVYERNQFFELTPAESRKLEQAHGSLFESIRRILRTAHGFEDFARRSQLAYVHFAERMTRSLRSLSVPEGLRGRGSEYSAELQIRILGLSDYAWLEPIVDLGSGIEAKLVQHLRERGLLATGIERRGRPPLVLGKDWFEVRFEPRSLGTIVSHLAFSLNFLHYHWRPGDRAYSYARKYMELLRSLVPGGLFCYAPGLPFIEAMLDPTEFEVSRLPLPEPLASTLASLRDIGTGQSIAYACHVRRCE